MQQDRAAKAQEYLVKLQEGFLNMRHILLSRFTHDNSSIMTNHSELRSLMYDFVQKAKAFPKEKVQVNKMVRENVQYFIREYLAARLLPLEKTTKDPHKFVTFLNEVWSQYQIFIFCHFFACEKLNEFFSSFYKMGTAKDFEYKCKYSDKSQVAPVPVLAVNQLKSFFEEIKLIQKFKSIFNNFLRAQREGKNVPRSQIRECVHSLQSCYFDMDAFCITENSRPTIIKREIKSQKLSVFRKSKDRQFFQNHLLQQTLNNLRIFYEDYVDKKLIGLNATDQIRKSIEILNEQESRAVYYIHSKENKASYIKVLEDTLIDTKLSIRITKQDGFKKYLELYEEGKEDYEKEIKDAWMVYSRVLDRSLTYIRDIFKSFLMSQAEKVAEKIKKPPDFILDLVRINGKCIKIVEFCNSNFELQTQRNNKIRGMLSNDLTEKGKKESKFDIGAKNLASFLNNKFKINYSKGGLQAMGDSYKQLVALFKILQEKTRFIDEEHKYMSTRLIEDIQFSKDLETGQIISMEKSFLQQVQKECGVSQVKELIENIKDIQKSIELNNRLKSKVRANDLFPLNQIIVKNGNFWPEKSAYTVQNPPLILQQSFIKVSEYFKNNNTNIQFEFNSGISLFKGDFDNGKKQNFQFKNIYMVILLFVDQQKKVLFGNLKKKIESVGTNKQKGAIQLSKAVLQLLYAGLLISPTKSIKPGTPNICKLLETDQLEVNRKFDFVEEEKKKKGPKGPPPKPLPILKGNILSLSEEMKRGFQDEIKAFNEDEKRIEAERKFKIQALTVKTLKHAHHHHMNCTFDQLYKVTQQDRKVKQFRVNEKNLKQIVEELINKKYCERVEGQRNVFRYIA